MRRRREPRVADQVARRSAGGRLAVAYDSVDSPGKRSLLRSTVRPRRCGRLTGIFHTAPFDQLSHADWRRMLSVHLDGGFHLGQPAFRVMKSQGYGRFVFIASSAGLFGQPLAAHYAAAKTGLLGLTNVIAVEGAPHGILANTVLPFGHSRMVTETVNDPKAIAASGFLSAIRPELVVPIVVFLASRACGFSHHNYSACAGRYARVFVGLGEGWLADPGSNPTADDIAAHLDDVSTTKSFTVPMSIFDEVVGVCARLGITG
jgi:NAD(P)-dependent dehydrogenase (short-subunit alcohol dehydrogenase family)